MVNCHFKLGKAKASHIQSMSMFLSLSKFVHCFIMRKLVHVKKGLAKHVDKQIQMICHSIADLGFYEIQVTKHYSSSMQANTCNMVIFINLT